jgi:non-ribosomal peptide synthetase component F
MAIHRIIEQRAATQGDLAAISDTGVSLSYRELNRRANCVARHLIAHGFRRGALATLRLPRSLETAIVLLGVLKAGGAYLLIDDEEGVRMGWPAGVSFSQKAQGSQGDAEEVRYLAIDVTAALTHPASSCANLPILTRGSDVACVLPASDDAPAVLVPHETIAALQIDPASRFVPWTGEPGALDLWIALMTGATATLGGSGSDATETGEELETAKPQFGLGVFRSHDGVVAALA